MRWLGPVERADLSVWAASIPDEDQHWTRYAAAMLLFSAGVDAADVRRAAAAAVAAAQPAAPARRAGPPGLRDGGVVHDEHQLAVVQRRDDDVVLLADDPARVPQLRLGGGRHGARRRASCAASRAAAAGRLGNFWVDLVRGTLYVFLPLSFAVRAAARAAGRDPELQALPRRSRRSRARSRSSRWGRWRARRPSSSSAPTAAASSTRTRRIRSRTRRRGPTSGRCSRSSSIPSALTYTFGRMVKNQKHGWAVWAAMFVLFIGGVDHRVLGGGARATRSTPRAASTSWRSATNPGGNMEGKEVRFGIANSALFATVTTDASCGAVNCDARLVHAARRAGPAGRTSSSARWSSAASAPASTACS